MTDNKLKKEKNKKNDLFLYIFVGILALVILILGFGLLKNKPKNVDENIFSSKYPTQILMCYSKDDVYTMVNGNGQFISCVFDNPKEQLPIQGDCLLVGGFYDNNKNPLYHIVDYELYPTTTNYFYCTNGLNDNDVFEQENWMYIRNEEIINYSLWNEFVENYKNNVSCSINIADNTNDGLILTMIYYHDNNFFVVEDDSRVWDIENNIDSILFSNKKHLEQLTIENFTLWYLTNEQGIGQQLLDNGTLANLVMNGPNNTEQLDMFWLWTKIEKIESNSYSVWKEEYNAYFPTIEIGWQEPDVLGTSFVLGEGKDAISGITGGEKGKYKKEEIDISSATLFANVSNTNENDSVLEGTHPLSGDLSSLIAKVNNNNVVSITYKNNIDTFPITIKVWRGMDMKNYDAKPMLETTLEVGQTYEITPILGLSFGEITYEGENGVCTWNFAINNE